MLIMANISGEASESIFAIVTDFASAFEISKEELRVLGMIAKGVLVDNVDLILDMSDSSNPFAYVKQIETLAAECEKLHKKLKAAPLDSRQRLYVDQIYAELEDLIRRLTWN